MTDNITIALTPEQNKLIDWAINSITEKCLAAGGKPEKIRARQSLDFFFCGLFYREGEDAVRDFVNTFNYTPPLHRMRGYA